MGGGIGGGVTGLSQGVPAAGEVAGQFEKVGGLGGFLSRGGLTSAIGRGIATNALTQGIGVATGLQSKFDFAGVAAAGIGAGAADFAGARTASWGSFGSDLATGMASALANAATRSVISGNSFGDNLIAALPDAIGGALGNAIGGAIAGDGLGARQTAKSLLKDAALQRGLKPGTPEYKRAVDINTPENKAFVDGIREIRKSGDATKAMLLLDSNYARLTGTPISEIGLARGLMWGGGAGLASGENFDIKATIETEFSENGPHETITGSLDSHGTAIHSLADPLVIDAGGLVRSLASAANETIDSIPGGRTAVKLLDWGLWIAGGPVKMAISSAVDRVGEKATEGLVGMFRGAGYDDTSSLDGGIGSMVALTAIVSGFSIALQKARMGAAEGKLGPIAGGGARLDNLSPAEITRIQNAADRTGTPISVVGSRANGTARASSDWDFVLPQGTPQSTRHSLSSSLPEGPRGIGEPRNQDFFLDPLDPTKPHITFPPRPKK